MWEFGLANVGVNSYPFLAARILTLPDAYVVNWSGPGVITTGSIVYPPGTVLPEEYVWFDAPPAAFHFPYGYPVSPDHPP